MKSDFLLAITQLSAEKNLPKEVVFKVVESALLSAYKKDSWAANQNISVRIQPSTGEIKVYLLKTVMENPTDLSKEISLADARKIRGEVELGGTIETEELSPRHAGRIAAQTAKQVVLQRLREAERETVFEEYAGREGTILSGVVQRMEPKQIIIDLGKAEAILPAAEQVKSERYRVGQRLKVYLFEVSRSNKWLQLIVSRSHKNLLLRLLELETPEIHNGIVEVKAIAREAGSRSKVAVAARQQGVDPVGSCVGLRGIRIQNIVNELAGERIDIIQWHPNIATCIANALSPAQVLGVEVNETVKSATVVVPDKQLSLAIGKEGQNVRLAAKLTGWKIDIKSATAAAAERAAKEAEQAALKAQAPPEPAVVAELLQPEPVAARIVEAVAPPEVAEPAAFDTKEPIAVGVGQPVGVAAEFEPAPAAEEKVEVPAGKPQIRFAEDILGDLTVGKPAKSKKRHDEEEKGKGEAVGKVKKARKRRVYDIEEDLQEYESLRGESRR